MTADPLEVFVEAGARALCEADGLTWDEARAPQADQGTQAEAYAVAAETALDAALAVDGPVRLIVVDGEQVGDREVQR